ncbi:conserved hypothetical protein [Neospora caninum Liverpool]|nr:conserved hypothetical protein [Neospora caninum Liverpool]CBZ54200.1 conserved hypothetical protein [Neospora caninum Liverpool]|eukprot:XP_003884231.1 conserved hypothetical protein [Neospora caninum Liverpool]
MKAKYPDLEMPCKTRPERLVSAEPEEQQEEGAREKEGHSPEEVSKGGGDRRAEQSARAVDGHEEGTRGEGVRRPSSGYSTEQDRNRGQQESSDGDCCAQSLRRRPMRLPPVSSETADGGDAGSRGSQEITENAKHEDVAGAMRGENVTNPGDIEKNPSTSSVAFSCLEADRDRDGQIRERAAFPDRHSARNSSLSLSPEKKKFCLASLPPPRATGASSFGSEGERASETCETFTRDQEKQSSGQTGCGVKGKTWLKLPPPAMKKSEDEPLTSLSSVSSPPVSASSASVSSLFGSSGEPSSDRRVEGRSGAATDRLISSGVSSAERLCSSADALANEAQGGGGDKERDAQAAEECSSFLSLDVGKIREKLRERRERASGDI